MIGDRPPSDTIVIDANIILSVILGRRSKAAIASVAVRRALVTSPETRREVMSTLAKLDVPPERVAVAEDLFSEVVVTADGATSDAEAGAKTILKFAVAARNGRTKDAHLLSLAWLYDADIWSHDRDFAGSGWPSWSSANLVLALAERAA